MEAVRGPKHPSEAKNGMEELIYKKFLNNLKNPLAGPIRFELRPQVRKIHEQPPRSLYKTLLRYVATAAAAGSNIPIFRYKIKGCYTAIPYRASTVPKQGFPCVVFPHRENPVLISWDPYKIALDLL